jgi:hypothetical protein
MAAVLTENCGLMTGAKAANPLGRIAIGSRGAQSVSLRAERVRPAASTVESIGSVRWVAGSCHLSLDLG